MIPKLGNFFIYAKSYILFIQVDIELILIEVSHSNQAEIDRTLMRAGYQVYKKLKNQDVIYKKNRSV